MNIYEEAGRRYQQFDELVHRCMHSRPTRSQFYQRMRNYYMNGCDSDDIPAIFNNIYPHLDQLASFLYAPDSTRFSLSLDATTDPSEYDKSESVGRRVAQEWHDSGAPIILTDALVTALTCDSAFLKKFWHSGEEHVFAVDPECIGVLDESLSMLSRQHAVCHEYQMGLSGFAEMIADHPRKDAIIEKISQAASESEEEKTSVRQILISRAQPPIQGNVIVPWYYTQSPMPDSSEPRVRLQEIWVWDESGDYRVVTRAEPGVVVYERKASSMHIRGELPFVQLCPRPKQGYFFGESEVFRLAPLQDMLNERMEDIRNLLHKQAHPTTVGSGLMGPEDELQRALTTADSFVPGDSQAFNVKQLVPQIPNDIFGDVQAILGMFDQVSGLGAPLRGVASNSRSAAHAAELARFGSSRARYRAVVVEDAIGKAATLTYQLLRKFSADQLTDSRGRPYVINQAPESARVVVDAHSSSPAFSEDNKELYFALFKSGAIDQDALIELTAPPMSELLRKRLRERQAAQALQNAAGGGNVVPLHEHRAHKAKETQ